MQICHVVPPNHLSLSDYSDYDFCLAHLALRDDRYKQFFITRKVQGRTVYMDNGVWERGVPIEADQMIELALEMQPDFIYAPDYMNDMYKTLATIESFGEKVAKISDFTSKIIGVAQGHTLGDWFACVVHLDKLPENFCHTIAINTLFLEGLYESDKHEGSRRTRSRLKLLRQIDQSLKSLSHKRFYATGFGAPIDAKELLSFPWITGVDTAIACVMASQGVEITQENAKFYKPKGVIDDIVFTDTSFAIRNMQIINTWVRGGEPF